jgi:hypothetical protein
MYLIPVRDLTEGAISNYISPKLPKSAPQWHKIQWKFWVNRDVKRVFGVADLRIYIETTPNDI